MERRRGPAVADALTALDRIYVRRACELAVRGRGSTSPNPAVGATIVLGARTLGEGFHRAQGQAHAEIEALAAATAQGYDVHGATAYVSLEPCDHTGLTGPCTRALLAAGIARVVVGTRDPHPRTNGAGIAALRAAGVAVDVADDPWSRMLVEDFARFTACARPFVRLKLAASLDGYVAPGAGERFWLTGDEARDYVRELRATHDAVLVGAGTVRVDDPELSVRPPRARRKRYVRVIACEDAPVPAERAIFGTPEGYAPTIVLAPAGKRAQFAPLEACADVVYVGTDTAQALDLSAALMMLRARDIASVLCEGGPTLAAALLASGLVDRVDWLLAPVLLGGPQAVPALANASLATSLTFDFVTFLGPDVLLSAAVTDGRRCSAD